MTFCEDFCGLELGNLWRDKFLPVTSTLAGSGKLKYSFIPEHWKSATVVLVQRATKLSFEFD